MLKTCVEPPQEAFAWDEGGMQAWWMKFRHKEDLLLFQRTDELKGSFLQSFALLFSCLSLLREGSMLLRPPGTLKRASLCNIFLLRLHIKRLGHGLYVCHREISAASGIFLDHALSLAAIGIPVRLFPTRSFLLLEGQRAVLAMEGERAVGSKPPKPGVIVSLEDRNIPVALSKEPILVLLRRPEERVRGGFWHRFLLNRLLYPTTTFG